ncbi:putative serine/threonine-protein kinase WNK1-like [Capsicum annuum]|nr:putative serine/threonine-protein kinase WNK1-like [Capsicum annuum]
MEDSVRSGGGVLKKKSSSGCLIIRKKDDRLGSIGGGISSSRPKFVMNEYELSDEISESIQRKNGRDFSNGSVLYGKSSVRDGEFGRNVNLTDLNKYEECDLKMQLNGYGEERYNMVERRGGSREFGSGSRSLMGEKRRVAYMDSSSSFSGSRTKGDGNGLKRRCGLLEDEMHVPISLPREDSRESIRVQGKNGVLKIMVNKKKKLDSMPKEYDPIETESRKGSWSADVVKRNLLACPSFYSGPKLPEKQPLSIQTEGNELKPEKPLLGKSTHLAAFEKDETDTSLKLAPPSLQPASPATRVLKEESRFLVSEDVTPAKRKDGKVNRGGSTEKQQLRERIRGMLIEAGWIIDYRPRKNREYLDAVYINPSGTAYWSIIKAYEAFQKRSEVVSGKSKPDGSSCSFPPISDDLINKLTRQTRKKIEKEMKKKIKDDGKRKDPKQTSVRESVLGTGSDQHEKKFDSYMKKKDKLLQGKLHASDQESGDNSSDNSLNIRRLTQDMAGKVSAGVASNSIHGKKFKLIGRCTLLARHSDKGENSDSDRYVPYTGKRTLLSWLIDTGTLKLRQKIQYVNRKRTTVKLEGWITQDGVHCGCCSKILPVSRFELHAGSKRHQPFQNIFLESGASLIECLVDAWNQQKESDRQDFYNIDIDGDDGEDDACGICGDGGDLICCDGCPSTFHQSCLGIQILPPGLWHCPNCTCKFCGAASRNHAEDSRNHAEDSERTVNEFLSCSLCDKKYHRSCSLEMNALPAISNNPSATFCGQKCQELYDHLQNILGVKHELEGGFSWSLIQRTDLESDTSRHLFPQRVECNSKLAVSLAVMDECFVPIVDRRSRINIIHNVLYNIGSNFSRLNFRGFYTAILEKGDDIISAASIRLCECLACFNYPVRLCKIRSENSNSMFIMRINYVLYMSFIIRPPIVFTSSIQVLSTLKVEKLIIPAISEHLHTWAKVFGFDELEESNKQELKSINLLVFPGTDMLQKKIPKKGVQEACELQQSHPLSPALVEKADQESSIRHDGHLHDGVCMNTVENPDDRFGSPASAVQLSDSTVVRAQGGGCESDTQISSKEVTKNFAESATKWMLSSLPSSTSDDNQGWLKDEASKMFALGPKNLKPSKIINC